MPIQQTKTIIDFVRDNVSVQTYIVLIVLMFIVLVMIVSVMISYNEHCKELDVDDFEEIKHVVDQLLITHRYSKGNEVRIYDSGVRFFRNGAFVTDSIDYIIRVECDRNKHDRTLYIDYLRKDKPVHLEVRCGAMDYFEYLHIRDMLFENAGL